MFNIALLHYWFLYVAHCARAVENVEAVQQRNKSIIPLESFPSKIYYFAKISSFQPQRPWL